MEGNEQCGDEDIIQEEEDTSLTTDQELEALGIARSIMGRLGILEEAGRKAFGTSQRILCNEKFMKMHQTTIKKHFRLK